MRATSVLFSKKHTIGWATNKARLPQNPNCVPFVELLPLTLRNRVSGKGAKTSDVACVQEMTILFACLKAHEFNEAPCLKEIDKLTGCYKVHMKTKWDAKQERGKGGVSTGKDLHARELNVYLKKFPVEQKP